MEFGCDLVWTVWPLNLPRMPCIKLISHHHTGIAACLGWLLGQQSPLKAQKQKKSWGNFSTLSEHNGEYEHAAFASTRSASCVLLEMKNESKCQLEPRKMVLVRQQKKISVTISGHLSVPDKWGAELSDFVERSLQPRKLRQIFSVSFLKCQHDHTVSQLSDW